MTTYEHKAQLQLQYWQHRMQRKPSVANRIAKAVQDKVNNIIPEKVHQTITTVIEKMVKTVVLGSQFTSKPPVTEGGLELREALVNNIIDSYRNAATVEGAVTGAGGILMGLADFPVLIAIKMKMLFEIAPQYGFDVHDYKERLYILYIFQLAFSSQKGRNEVYAHIAQWQGYSSSLPDDAKDFDWRTFQQEYRDFIDLAKMAQLIPFIGAAVGAVVNYRLINQLGETAINCYRMRRFSALQIMPAE